MVVLCSSCVAVMLLLYPVEDGGVEVDMNSLIEILSSSGPNTRLPKPAGTPPEMYNLMMKCWNSDPDKRPGFEQLKTELENQIPPWTT